MSNSYENKFYDSLKLGAVNGFKAVQHPSIKGSLLTKQIIDTLREKLVEAVRGDISVIAGQCFKVHYMMRPIVEELLGAKAYFTLGYIKLNGEYQHKMELSVLLDMLSKGLITDPKMKLHAWITLPNMEIIDFTTLTSVAFANNSSLELVDIIYGLSGSRDVDYYPQLSGNE
ncbi:hypothetical protein Q4503_10925 [Colwellia sp. 6_MG-2023]|uniref:hypothetical protein n=1 Tax=Colwellia sp. 6_MG-2023 TaxID=3062676 RepID=UPI0026E393B4|nr:hypothetical protein [Colwellia sp. 6_MG-2023]MDO6488216.1 hypothetical protein [Colwellia sp. 6_MG-2023]